MVFMKRYNPKEIEPKWQKKWEEDQTYVVDFNSDKPKYVAFGMFNYPSGAGIHVGHVRNFTIPDVITRVKRQQGHESYQPVGWDSFGLPAENYAIKTGVAPQVSIKQAIEKYHEQYRAMGWAMDWTKEIDTTEPEYYRWTQWCFSKLFENGLAYQQESPQWWCDQCKTVLADEQVIAGKCWRHDGADDPMITKKNLKQWFFKITEFADEMLDATDDLDWTQSVKSSQKSWIGRSVGAEIEFAIVNSSSRNKSQEARSYVMGQKNISKEDIEEIGGKVEKVTETGHLCVTFPQEFVEKFEELITSKIEPGFWNEYIGDDIVFIFKSKEGEVIRQVWDPTNESELVALCNNYADASFTDIRSMLAGNDWYKGRIMNQDQGENAVIKVFTTRPDTLFGATFMVLAPEHPMVDSLAIESQKAEIKAYKEATVRKSEVQRQQDADKEKTGVFTGSYAINPANNEEIPIWIADYVLMGYGTGAIMAVPAHDERDNDFAKKFNLPILRVVQNDASDDECSHDEGVMINSGDYNSMNSDQMREKIVADLATRGVAQEKVNYKMRDWLISRQRYWGAPIPIIHCEKDGPVLVPESELPVVLPEIEDYRPTGGNTSALAGVESWVNTKCPKCGGPGKRETDTMDGYVCSSWYFLRYMDPTNNKKAWDEKQASKWMPVDCYNGGDHATAHLLYARFFNRFFHKLGFIESKEPFKKMIFHGKIKAGDGSAFSKSKGNGVDPLQIIEQGYGADAIRLYQMFSAPLELDILWDEQGIPGAFRYLSRVWTITQEYIEADESSDDLSNSNLLKATHVAIKKVSEELNGDRFNTAIAGLMEFTNALYKEKTANGIQKSKDWQFALECLVQLLAPFAPHITEELWRDLGHTDTVHVDHWPIHDEKYLISETVKIVVQVNGKVRTTIEVSADSNEEQVVEHAKQDEKIAEYLVGGQIKKSIYVPNKLVNLVI
jgi:leucyl-tRNA synthetase